MICKSANQSASIISGRAYSVQAYSVQAHMVHACTLGQKWLLVGKHRPHSSENNQLSQLDGSISS